MENLNKLYKDLTHQDPHFRQNAVISLGRYFSDTKARESLTPDEKSNIVSQLLTRLEPKEDSIEVKGRTVKVFSQIACFLSESEIIQLFTKIIKYLTNKNSEGKDIYVTCIKTIFTQAPGSLCYMIGKVIIPELITGINSNNDEVVSLCLSTFSDYINTFDNLLILDNNIIQQKEQIAKTAANYIDSKDITLQANAIYFLGTFSVLLSTKQISSLLDIILNAFKNKPELKTKIAYFEALNSIAKVSAIKQVNHIRLILPLINTYSSKTFLENDNGDYDEKNDLAQAVLNLTETYVHKLSTVLGIKCNEIAKMSLDLIEYDPNYTYDMNNQDIEMNYNEYDDYYDYEMVATMDDSSWKVRKAATNVLHSVVKSGVQLNKELKINIILKLVDCLKEHDDNTKIDIITCLGAYLSQLVENVSNELTDKNFLNKNDFISSITNLLIETISKDIKNKNTTIVTEMLNLLPIVASLGSTHIINSFTKLQPKLNDVCFTDNAFTLSFYKFLTNLFKANTPAQQYDPIKKDLIAYLTKGISHDYYKITLEALNAIYYFIPLLSKNDNKQNEKYASQLFEEVFPKFKMNDLDSEIKIALINVMSQIVISYGHAISSNKLNNIFKILLDKIAQPTLRSHILTSIINILTQTNIKTNLGEAVTCFKQPILNLISNESLHVQYEALMLLEIIYVKYPKVFIDINANLIKTILAMKADTSLIALKYKVFKAMISSLKESQMIEILHYTDKILTSIQAGEEQLTALFDFIRIISSIVSTSNLSSIINKYKTDISHINVNLSKFIAILVTACKEENKYNDMCFKLISSSNDEKKQNNALLLLGDICLFSKNNYTNYIKQLESLSTQVNTNIEKTVAITIGKIGLSNTSFFIKKVCQNKPQKSILVSLREMLLLLSQDTNKNKQTININELQDLFKMLKESTSKDKELNLLCGECLGLLTAYEHKFITSYINSFSNDAKKNGPLYYGLKFIFNIKENYDEQYLSHLITKLIEGLKDKERTIKESSYDSLIKCFHNYPSALLKQHLVLFKLFEDDHLVRKEWISEVDFGSGCKLQTDNGLNIRKNVYNAMKVFVDKYYSEINIQKIIELCLDGIVDTEEIQILAYGIITKIAKICPSAFLGVIDNMCVKIKTFMGKIRLVEPKKKVAGMVKKFFDSANAEGDIKDNPNVVNLLEEIKTIIV